MCHTQHQPVDQSAKRVFHSKASASGMTLTFEPAVTAKAGGENVNCCNGGKSMNCSGYKVYVQIIDIPKQACIH